MLVKFDLRNLETYIFWIFEILEEPLYEVHRQQAFLLLTQEPWIGFSVLP